VGKHGVEPVIAIMLLIALSVVSSVAIRVVSEDLTSCLKTSVNLASMDNAFIDSNQDTVVLHVRNVGNYELVITHIYLESANGKFYVHEPSSSIKIQVGEVKEISFATPFDIVAGEKYLVSLTGGESGFKLSWSIVAKPTIQSKWIEYKANPLFSESSLKSGVEPYYPCVIYDEEHFGEDEGVAIGSSSAKYLVTPYYKMWFDGHDGVYFAYSSDGLTWHIVGKVSGLNPGVDHRHPVVIYDGNGFGSPNGPKYKIYYWTNPSRSIDAIRYAESYNGLNWTSDQTIQQDPNRPLVDGVWPGWWYQLYGAGCVLYNASGTNDGSATPNDYGDDKPMTYKYVMYYDLGDGNMNNAYEWIGLAYSTDGKYWIRYGDNPVLVPDGNVDTWDGKYNFHASVIIVKSKYYMWYSGANGVSYGDATYAHGIGFAYSSDGINWIKSSKPVFHIFDNKEWRLKRSYTPCVIYDASRFNAHGDNYAFKMWFTGKSSAYGYAIGLAYSQNPTS